MALRRRHVARPAIPVLLALVAVGLSACVHREEIRAPEPEGAADRAAFDRLRSRPFREPRISIRPGKCVFPAALSPATEEAPNTGEAALGDGPVYIAFASTHPRSLNTYPGETFWVSAPSYRGPVLVRGRGIDAPGTVRFGSALTPSSELRLPAGSWDERTAYVRERWPRASWRGWRFAIEHTRVDPDGCYAVQIDGESFSDVILFASTP